MNISLSRTAAFAGAGLSILCRLFYGLMIESPEVSNGAWLSVAIGFILSVPLILLFRAERAGRYVQWVLLPLLLLDAGDVVEIIAFSESCLAFNHIAKAVLMVPLILTALWCAFLGGDAIGASARIWMHVFLFLMLVIIICQRRYYHPAWLTPALGYGWEGILRAAVRAAGWMSAIALSAMRLCSQTPRRGRVLRCMALACAAAVALIVFRSMKTPVMDGDGLRRDIRIDAILTNGRAPLYLQLPMIVIWFVAILHLFCFECAVIPGLAERCIPGGSRTVYILACISIVAILAFSGWNTSLPAQFVKHYRYPLLLSTLTGAVIFRGKGGSLSCVA